MTKQIRVLDEQTINKIAAGEVIENPASVVKELIENALDAGARDIHIDIQCGGRQLIRVTDDGCGMSRDDALLCLERYATSKIRQMDDLNALLTMGFRGEALPSIAAISKLTLLTAVAGAQEGTLVLVEGGRIVRCCGAAREAGTTLEVKALFFNVPVRQKFQKSPAFDTAAIQKVVSLQALSHPQVRFTLISDQQSLLVAPTTTSPQQLDQLRERTSVVLGREFVDTAVPIQASADGCNVYGLLGLPTSHRPNRAGQYLMINHRVVMSPLVAMAVRDGYGTALPTQRYPTFVLNLTLPGDLLDVNVHPQKSEVRLRHESSLRDLLRRAVSSALQSDTPCSVPASRPLEPPSTRASALPPLPWDATPPITMSSPLPESRPAPFGQVSGHQHIQNEEVFRQSQIPKVLLTLPGYVLLDPHSTRHLDPNGTDEPGLWILDQRAAHHRILFDRLAAQQPKGVEMEQFLIPIPLALNRLECDLMAQAMPELLSLGFQVEPFGPSSFCLRAIPCEFSGMDVGSLIVELVQEVCDPHTPSRVQAERRRRLAQRASQAALTRQQQLPLSSASRLLVDLFRCEQPFRCPNGHATLTRLDSQRFATLFHE